VKLIVSFLCASVLIGAMALACEITVAAQLVPQTAEDVEKRIANLPADQRAYERFRFWVTTVPPEQRTPAPLTKYREYLLERGFSPGDADEQIKIIQTQSNRLEVERWNNILTAPNPTFNTKPNEFLVEMTKGRKVGTALDVGMGQGRNAIWLAQQGWDVTGFDPAERAVAVALETAKKLGVALKTEIKGIEDFDFGERRWDLIVLSYVGGREMAGILERALKPGGLVIIEAFHRDATRGRSIGGDVVFDTGELVKLYPELRVVRYEEPIATPDFGGPSKVRVVRYCGERPE
jgi:SAM-dependent methyltransferase